MENNRINIWAAKQPPKFKKMYITEMLRYKQLLKMLPLNLSTVIDIGCGKGYMDYLLAQEKYTITAVDISEDSLKSFSEIAKKYSITQICADFFTLDLKNFDLVLSQEMIEHIEDYQAALDKLYTFVRSGGYGLFSVPYKENLQAKMINYPETGKHVHRNGHLHSFTRNKFVDSIKQAGFKIVRVELITNKRAIKWLASLRLPVNIITIYLDRILNILFPNKATFIAVLAEKENKA
ncbi:methyltransferase domain-containing protein [candidate division KSB1 bacterium]|nr:methyltransferase domain-containing protein [candidate division KSB1 bacterium]